MAERPHVLLVLGMHRSGTSALTRVLNLLGAALPDDLLGGNRSNPSGHWESRRVIAIHEDLLAALGRRWDDLRDLPEGWLDHPATQTARARIDAFIADELVNHALSVVKDPRLCLLAPLWLHALDARGIAVGVIVPLRDPRDVADSLQRRDGMAPGVAMRMWQRHVMAAERASRGRARVLVRFDALHHDWRGVAAHIAQGLGIDWPIGMGAAQAGIEAFLQPRDPHAGTEPESASLPAAFAQIKAVMDAGDDAACFHAIAALPAPSADPVELLALASADIAARELRIASLGEQIESARGDADAVHARMASLAASLHEHEQAAQAWRVELLAAERERDTRMQACAQRDARIAEMETAQADDRVRIDALLRKLADFDRQLAAKTGQAELLARTLAQVEETCRIMEQSRSWKLTAPLRAFNAARQHRRAHAPGSRKRTPTPAMPGFDPAFYLAEYPDVRAAGLDPYQHYLEHGKAEGRLPMRPPHMAIESAAGFEPNLQTVLVVSHDASRTGAPVLSLNLIAGLREHYNVVCLPLRGGNLMEAFARHATVVLDPLAYGGDAARMVAALDTLGAGQRLAFAIVNSIESRAVLPLLAARGVPTICLIHEFAAYTRPRHAFPDAVWWATRTVFSTTLTRDAALEAFPEFADADLRVLPQGRCTLTAEQIDADARRAEEAWLAGRLRPEGWRGDTVLVLGIGSVQQRKGVDLFVQCAAQALALPGGERCRFAWIGHGYDPEHDLGYSAYLEDQVRRSGLDGKLIFIGETAHIETAYRTADLLLVSSRLDPLPNVAIDAMAHGLPVLCFERATGIADVLVQAGLGEDCVCGYLDTAQMATKMLALAGAPQRRRAIGAHLRELAARDFSMDVYVERLRDLAGEAAAQMAHERHAVAAIAAADVARLDFFRREPVRGQPIENILRCEYVRPWAAGVARRKLFPGFHPGVWAQRHGVAEPGADPLADWLAAGQPEGPWRLPVIEPSNRAGAAPASLRVALHVHAYYVDLLPAIVQRLRGNRLHPDLFVSVHADADAQAARQAFQGYPGRVVEVRVVPNRGRDIGPLLTAFASPLTAGYDVIGHVHTKKTADLADAAVGECWFDFLLENLLGGKARMLDAILARMVAEQELGLVFPDDPNVVGWGANLPFAQALGARLGLGDFPRHFAFPVGTMFWARTAALRPLFDLKMGWDDYPSEPLPYDGSLLHALERLLPFVAATQGLRCALTNVPGATR
ncbi:MAG: glycosyltransferase [Proteobacteria bacterium]|nr:glycosyltransferase [Pseudomonadota bacterium]